MSSMTRVAPTCKYTPVADLDLASIRQCCRQGPPATRSRGALNKQWELVRTRLFEEVRVRAFRRISPYERELLERIAHTTTQGRQAAANGMPSDSRRIFESAKKELTTCTEISEETRLLCIVEHAAAEAYLECLCGAHDNAHELLRDSYNAATKLWIDFGYAPMRAQRIHLLNNVIRVDALAGRYQSGITVVHSLLRHLSGDPNVKLSELHNRGWMSTDIWEITTALGEDAGPRNEFLITQTIHEFALLMSMLSHEEAQREAGYIFYDVEMNRISSRWPPALQSWFDLKRQFLTCSGMKEFLCAGQSFLSQEDETCSLLLWFTVALDVAAVCDFFPGDGSLEQEVLRGAASASVPRLIPRSRLQVNVRWRRA
jgi:hypothetical protein